MLVLVAGAVVALLGYVVVVGKKVEEDTGINWDPVWLGGEMPWGVKVYQNTSSFYRGWRVEVLHRGVFCVDKEWQGRRAKYVTEAYARLWAVKWIEKNPGGCPS